MTGVLDPESGRRYSDEELASMSEHLSEWRRFVSEHRIRRQALWSGLVIGLAVHVAGFLLKSSATGGPIGVLADLLYTLGWALWTGVVVVTLVEIIPAVKERQISRALDSYEAALRSRARTNDDARASPDTQS
jgi:hypothetical protein